MKRYADVKELLEAVEQDVIYIESAYDGARRDEEVQQVVRPKIKCCLESLRSSLEYFAQDIWESYTKKQNKIYFPYGATEENFLNNQRKNLPAVDTQAPECFALIRSIQQFECGDSWLVDLCKLVNINKHKQLSAQTRRNSAGSTTALGNIIKMGLGDATFINCSVNGAPLAKSGKLVLSSDRKVSDMTADLLAPVPILREYEWVNFEIGEDPVDALKLIQRCRVQITDFGEKLHSVLA
jgi:hypothetical protein